MKTPHFQEECPTEEPVGPLATVENCKLKTTEGQAETLFALESILMALLARTMETFPIEDRVATSKPS